MPIERGIEILRALRGRTSGFAIPLYVLDTPYGKVPLDYRTEGREGDDVVVEPWTGGSGGSPTPPSPAHPADAGPAATVR